MATQANNNRPIIIVRRIKKGGGGHHGGAWKVAYADFVTAMMAFFLVMWIVGLNKPTRDAIAAYFKNPTLFNKGGGKEVLGNGSTGADGKPAPVKPIVTNAGVQALLQAKADAILKE